MIFDTYMKKTAAMIAFVLSLMISCQSMRTGLKPVTAENVIVNSLPFTPPHLDTPKFQPINNRVADTIKQEYEQLKAKNNVQKSIPIDSLVSLNYQWQYAYLRAVNRNIRNTDSLKILIKQQGAKADAYYTKAERAGYYIEQTKHAEVSSNWVFYTGFGIMIIFMMLNTRYNYLIKKQTA